MVILKLKLSLKESPKYKFSVYSADMWLQIKELLAVIPRKKSFHN